MSTISEPLRILYAKAFRAHFDADFVALDVGAPAEFELTPAQMHEWLAGSGYAVYLDDGVEMEFIEVPLPGTPDWAKFSEIFSKVRKELNSAAQYGAYGDPAFRIDSVRPNFVVRNMASLAIVTGSRMARGLKSLADTNDRRLGEQHSFLAEHLDDLPPALQHQIGQHNRMFSAMVRRITTDLNEYLAFTDADFQEAQEMLRLNAPK